jgi:hypothetical protein
MLTVTTKNPKTLLARIQKEIGDGRIRTWELTERGSFTHTASSGQWRNKAWFKPSIGDGAIQFNILRPKGSKVSKEV